MCTDVSGGGYLPPPLSARINCVNRSLPNADNRTATPPTPDPTPLIHWSPRHESIQAEPWYLTSALAISERFTSHPPYPTGDWMDPAGEMDVWEKTFFLPTGIRTPNRPARSHYITFVTTTPRKYRWHRSHSKYKKRKAKSEWLQRLPL